MTNAVVASCTFSPCAVPAAFHSNSGIVWQNEAGIANRYDLELHPGVRAFVHGTAAWLLHRRDCPPAVTNSEKPQSADTSAALRADDAPPGVSILKPYAAPETDAPSDLRLVHRMLENFSLLVKGDDPLPLGSNDEIAAALRGKNKARLVFLPPGHPAFNEQGQLIDRWGTPLFFHASSRDRIDIRSAGQDRQMWTADDIHQRKDGATFTGGELPSLR